MLLFGLVFFSSVGEPNSSHVRPMSRHRPYLTHPTTHASRRKTWLAFAYTASVQAGCIIAPLPCHSNEFEIQFGKRFTRGVGDASTARLFITLQLIRIKRRGAPVQPRAPRVRSLVTVFSPATPACTQPIASGTGGLSGEHGNLFHQRLLPNKLTKTSTAAPEPAKFFH